MDEYALDNYFKEISFEPLLKKQVGNTDGEKHFNSLILLPNQFAYSINNALSTVPQAKGFDTFLGYPDNNISLSFLFGLFHPDEAPQMRNLVRNAYIFGLSRNPPIPFSVQLMISYRVRKADGTYIKILRQSTILEVDHNSRLVSNLSICTDISAFDKSNEIHFQMIGLGADEFPKTLEAHKQSLLVLTPREKEILEMLAQGLVTKEIADKLKTSILTVETQRKKLLKKYNMKNTAHMIYVASEAGLI